ncbi:aspartate aminotransferase family protein [Congregibacter litoralis]|uniref:Acetylornithine aminotransferase n=1 Tax=Congregibacter litoralis KT71 TaxID=314285 RepID=A4A9M9_9GAMM|nr:aspartate aminotransferase family protein [Congregibacter litoralis]EAQ97196.2 acetylornithine aminotransferase apoenzyme [Congregibacter litoralis KT71]
MSALMSTYSPLPVSFTHGRGAELFDAQGRAFLDGLSGIAVTNLGHGHPRVTAAVSEQAAALLHCSNIYHIDLQEQVGETLTRRAAMETVFFSNSGAEANEAAIKLARLHGHQKGIERPQVVVLEGAFHGRTMAALSATGNRKIQAGFGPLLSGFLRAPRNDLRALEALSQGHDDIAAVMLEPVQGESGIHPLDLDYLKAVASLCAKNGYLLIFDEVQSGNGRTGSYFYYQQIGIAPDVVTTAKALGNGVPIGACLARGDAAHTFAPGHHGSTYGGNPLACAAAGAVLETLAEDQLQERAEPLGRIIQESFTAALKHKDAVADYRRAGLMIGIELKQDCAELVRLALDAGLLINVTAARTIRLLPPLVMSDAQGRQLGETLAAVVDRWLDQNPVETM